MGVVKVYTVMPSNLVEKLSLGDYVPEIDLGFSRYHPSFRDHYNSMKNSYRSLVGVPMLSREGGLWGYLSPLFIDKSSITSEESLVVCYVDSRFLLKSDYNLWEKILDGVEVYENLSSKLFTSRSGTQQVYFSSAVVEKVEVINFG